MTTAVLERDVILGEGGVHHQVGQDIERQIEMLAQDAGVETGVFHGRVRLERADDAFERQRQVERRAPRRTIEHHVFHEVRDAGGVLVHRHASRRR